jgi:hypothetical protein
MANKKRSKMDKKTRDLIEKVSELVKRKDNKYRLKGKKKVVRNVKQSCPHWIFRKRKDVPTVREDRDRPGYWQCLICKRSFPIDPYLIPGKDNDVDEIKAICNQMLELVDHASFYGARMGGDGEDTTMFVQMKRMIPRFEKSARSITKLLDKRKDFQENKNNSSANPFRSWGYNF